MAYIQCKSGGAETPTLLWENSSPTSAFASQTINIDLTNFQAIGFLLQNRNDSGSISKRYQIFIAKNKPTSSDALACSNDINVIYATSVVPIIRPYSINTVDGKQKIWFGNGESGYDASTDNHFCIPLKIYGYKKALI